MEKNRKIDINRIVHVSAASPYMDDGTYQETILANEQIKTHDSVTIIATNIVLHNDGSKSVCHPQRYHNNNGVQIIRFNSHRTVDRSRGNVYGLYKILKEEHPDFVMDHGFCPTSSVAILLYKWYNKECKLICDSHMTRANYNDNNLGIREKTMNYIQRVIGKVYFRLCDRIYGITEQTLEMLKALFDIPWDKAEVLPLGYDDSKINCESQTIIRQIFRKTQGIPDDKLVFVHGGKLVRDKRTLEIVRAVKDINDAVLVVFGEFYDANYEELVKNENSRNVIYLGYLESKEIYDVFLSSDCAVFPGKPSCLRQEAVACGLPIIFCQNEGDEDINILMNNNGIKLSTNWNQEKLEKAIRDMIDSIVKYRQNAEYLANNDFKKYAYSVEAEYILYN